MRSIYGSTCTRRLPEGARLFILRKPVCQDTRGRSLLRLKIRLGRAAQGDGRAEGALRRAEVVAGAWVVTFSRREEKPTNCIYLISPEGKIEDRYDKSFCTATDQQYYSAGNRLVTREIRGVRIGLAICYDICWPQLYIAYRELGTTVMVHSMYNARAKAKDCLDTLNVREVPTRCADNRMWAVVNNSSQPYSHWGSFIARPDATIASSGDERAGDAGSRFSGYALRGRLVKQLQADEDARR